MISADARSVRDAIRRKAWRGSTAGAAPGFAQANLIVVTADWADELRRFCLANAAPCPLLDVTEPGSPHPLRVAPEADLRTDVPGYRIYEAGAMRQLADIVTVWRDDHVAFLLGCSFSFERALVSSGIPMRHADLGRVVPMYVTDRQCARTERLRGPLVVSMRPIPKDRVATVQAICREFPGAHGEPVHVGDSSSLGIATWTDPITASRCRSPTTRSPRSGRAESRPRSYCSRADAPGSRATNQVTCSSPTATSALRHSACDQLVAQTSPNTRTQFPPRTLSTSSSLYPRRKSSPVMFGNPLASSIPLG